MWTDIFVSMGLLLAQGLDTPGLTLMLELRLSPGHLSVL